MDEQEKICKLMELLGIEPEMFDEIPDSACRPILDTMAETFHIIVSDL